MITLTHFCWLIARGLTLFSTVFQLYRGSQCTYPCFPGVLLTSTLHNILSKPLGAFPYNHCQNNRQRWRRNESCRNDYHQSWERILAEPRIVPATSCSQVRNATDWAVGLGNIRFKGLSVLWFLNWILPWPENGKALYHRQMWVHINHPSKHSRGIWSTDRHAECSYKKGLSWLKWWQLCHATKLVLMERRQLLSVLLSSCETSWT